jgi:hypothetical protein
LLIRGESAVFVLFGTTLLRTVYIERVDTYLEG